MQIRMLVQLQAPACHLLNGVMHEILSLVAENHVQAGKSALCMLVVRLLYVE